MDEKKRGLPNRVSHRYGRAVRLQQGSPVTVRDSIEELYDEVNRTAKRGDYTDELHEKAKRLSAAVDTLVRKSSVTRTLLYLKSKSLVLEILDYFGNYSDASRDAQSAPTQFSELPQRVPPSLPLAERKLVRERIRFVLDRAHALYYRRHDYFNAERETMLCRDLLVQIQDEKDFPCYGTRAHVAFNLGRVRRQLDKYDESETAFGEAIEYYRRRVEYKSKQFDSQHMNEELTHMRYKVGVSLALGLGWLNYTRGLLTRALYNNILPAQVLLADIQDPINRAYVNLVFGSTLRSLRGHSPDELDMAIQSINDAYKVFEKYEHDYYKARAAYELALAHLHGANFGQAESCLKDMETILKTLEQKDGKRDSRWFCNLWILRSRLSLRQKKDPVKAQKYADKALYEVRHANQILCEMDARIARAEALIEQRQYESACVDLNEALERARQSGNPKIQAACHLHLARCHCGDMKELEAKRHLGEWEYIEGKVEHWFLRNLAGEVRNEVNKMAKDFLIRAVGEESLKYRQWNERLQSFLIRAAIRRIGDRKVSDNKIATELSISPVTAKLWRKKYEKADY